MCYCITQPANLLLKFLHLPLSVSFFVYGHLKVRQTHTRFLQSVHITLHSCVPVKWRVIVQVCLRVTFRENKNVIELKKP